MASSFAATYPSAQLPPEEMFSEANLDAFLAMLNAGAEPFLVQAKETGVPGLETRIQELFNESGGGMGEFGAPAWVQAIGVIQQAKLDPAGYATTRLGMLARNYTLGTVTQFGDDWSHYAQGATERLQEIKDLSSYVISNNYMAPDRKSVV